MMFSDYYRFVSARLGFDDSESFSKVERLLDAGRELPSISFSIADDGSLGRVASAYRAQNVRYAAHKGELAGEFAKQSLTAAQLRGSDDVFGFESVQDEMADYVSIYPGSMNWREEIVRQKTIDRLDEAETLLGAWAGPVRAILDKMPQGCVLSQVDVPLRAQLHARVHVRPVCVFARGLDAPLDGASALLEHLGLEAQASVVREWTIRHPQSGAARCWKIVLSITTTGEIEDEAVFSLLAPKDTHRMRGFAKSEIKSPRLERFRELVRESITAQQYEKVSSVGDGFKMPYLDEESNLRTLRIYAKNSSLDVVVGLNGVHRTAPKILLSPYVLDGSVGKISNLTAVQWHITDACDQRCKHCYIFAEDSSVCIATTPYEKLISTLDELLALFDKARMYFRPIITGGDPILHPRFWDFLRAMHDRGLAFNILGNPFHLTPEVCDRLRELGCQDYQLSLDGLEKFHDSLRKPGSFKSTLRAIELLQDSGVNPVIMLTVSNANIDEVEDVANLCAKLRVGRFAFARYCPTSEENAMELHIEPERYRTFLNGMLDLYNEYRKRDSFTRFYEKEHLFTLVHWERGEFEIPKGAVPGAVYEGCHCAQGLCILPNRDVVACRRMESVLGNLNDSDVMEIAESPVTQGWRDVSKLEKCSKCELLGWCRGCQAVGAGYTGNRCSPDPQCWRNLD